MTKRTVGAILIAVGAVGVVLFAGPVGVWGFGVTILFPCTLLGGLLLRYGDDVLGRPLGGGTWR